MRAYHGEKDTVNSWGVREMFRKVLASCNAISVRAVSGGLYFAAQQHGDRVDNLETLASRLPGGVEMFSWPLIDDTKQRAMLRQAYESDAVNDVDQLIDEISGLRSKGKVSADRIAGYMDRLQVAQSRDVEYSSLLEFSVDKSATRIKVLQRLIMEMLADAS